ncbi:hypothetical protein AGOR_G00225390 [Albula goreensis]|uniref:Uncharacterized protein n=1 Tax=Albula goreensis TaxID=1534307 RepID=A0A8T3CP78_9TELE|nr:hypothetical protein AGOR_G00225390 [Albula goreensis]
MVMFLLRNSMASLICLSVIVCLQTQIRGCAGLERYMHMSCNDLRTDSGFRYSYEITQQLETEEWNSTQVLARWVHGCDPEFLPVVKEFSHGSITLQSCMNVSYWSFDFTGRETLIHFIIAEESVRVDDNSNPILLVVPICIVSVFIVLLLMFYFWNRETKRFTCGLVCARGDPEHPAAGPVSYTPAQADGHNPDE